MRQTCHKNNQIVKKVLNLYENRVKLGRLKQMKSENN